MNDKIIEWESQHLEVDPISNKLFNPKDIPEQNSHNDEYHEDYEDGDDFLPIQSTKFTITAFGANVDSSLHPHRQFKLWLANTNFSITKGDYDKLCKVDGVEIVIPVTRYKFIVGVGKLFDFSKVRVDIEFVLCNKHKIDIAINHIHDPKVQQELREVKKLVQEHKQWIVYIFPNGKIEYSTSDSKDFTERTNLFKEAQQLSNGILIQNG